MTDPLDTSSLPPITINSGKRGPEPMEECVSVWADDLCERLRAGTLVEKTSYGDVRRLAHPDAIAAADRIEAQVAEIAKLNSMIEMIKEAMVQDIAEKMALAAEVARSWNALTPLAGIKADDGDDFSTYDPQTIIRCEVTAGDIQAARAALSHKNEAPRD